MRARLAAGEDRGGSRFHRDNLNIGVLRLEVRAYTGERAARADACNENIDLTVRVCPDFRAGRLQVHRRVGRVRELARNVAVWGLLGELLRLCDSARHTLCTFGENKLRTVSLQKVAALHTHRLRHGKDYLITAGSRNGSKADARVAACRFNDNCAGLQEALFLGVVQHRFCDTVLYAACRVEILKLRVDFRVQFICFFVVGEFKKRSAADEVCDFLIYTHGKVSLKYFI